MNQYVLIHYGELVLKKGNRNFFEQILKQNIQKALQGVSFRFIPCFGRFCLKFSKNASQEKVRNHLKHVFGISNFLFAFRASHDFDEYAKIALSELKKKNFKTFCVRVNRVRKNLPKTSVELERELGAYLLENGISGKVQLKNPDITVQIDLLHEDAFISFEKIPGSGGLPVGSTGHVIALISGGIDSPVASYRIMKRGARVIFIHFHSYPFTDQASQEHVRELVRLLNRYQFSSKIYFVPFGNFQKIIVAKAPAKLRVLLYRRAMMRIAETIAHREKCLALVTGESLGQVASQTLENLLVTNSALRLPVFRPLIGMDKEEIISEGRKIGTYAISIQPYGDCCSLFVPEHPETKARLEILQQAETTIGFDQLVHKILPQISWERL